MDPPPHLGKAQSTIYEKIHNPSLESLVNSEEDIILKSKEGKQDFSS